MKRTLDRRTCAWLIIPALAGLFTLAAASDAHKAPEPAAKPALATATMAAPASPATPPAGHARGESPESPAAVWADLLEGNRRFAAGSPMPRPLVRTRQDLAMGQHPKVMVLGCADSRVPPELVFDKNLGDLFVVRTAGNIADPVALGSLEYAAEHLHASVLVVLGHRKCGAVKAAASGEPMPSENLNAIVQKISPVIDRLQACFRGDQLASEAVVANVHQSAEDVLANSEILRNEVEKGRLTVFKAVYDLDTGQVEPLD